jgi:glutamyl endopeptidase
MSNRMHTAVSSQPMEEPTKVGAEEAAVFEGPSEGYEGRPAPPTEEGLEQVKGYTQPESPENVVVPAVELPDIAEASFGPPPPLAEVVHPPDDRVQITNTADYPWRVHCYLQITARDNSLWRGTGWFIGPHTVITAGHVVFIKGSGVPGRDGWVKSITVMPGRNGATLPYGSVTSFNNFRSVSGWTDFADQNYDYGAVILPTDLGSRTGFFGFGVYADSDLLNTTGNIAGYPGDKPSGTLWYAARRIASVTARKVFYDIDTAGGQSGSAVYRILNNARYGFAVHAHGGAVTNSGPRVVTDVYNNFLAWKA